MRIKEAAEAVGCTRRAIKYYEEQGLLPSVSRFENGYRDYSEDDLDALHRIQAYRKLGLSIRDIKKMLAAEDDALFLSILERKKLDLTERQHELAALESFITSRNCRALNESIDFESIRQSIQTQLPGFFGVYLSAHFSPYLDICIETPEQMEAYQVVLSFWDDPQLRLPLAFRLTMLFTRLLPVQSPAAADSALKAMLHPTPEEYERMKENILKTVRMRENPLVRYSLPELFKRSTMRRLRDCGYYDIFIPAMERLSPPYKAYKDALNTLNSRVCRDLNLYYDSDFNLRIRK